VGTHVTDNTDQHRFEIFLDGELAGFTKYHPVDGGIAFDHTEIDDKFEGKGLGSTLVRTALDDVRGRDLVVLPYCPFVRSYIARNREYVDLVPEDRRPQFDLG
jgi:predicted GNAT family acetyltransferase